MTTKCTHEAVRRGCVHAVCLVAHIDAWGHMMPGCARCPDCNEYVPWPKYRPWLVRAWFWLYEAPIRFWHCLRPPKPWTGTGVAGEKGVRQVEFLIGQGAIDSWDDKATTQESYGITPEGEA